MGKINNILLKIDDTISREHTKTMDSYQLESVAWCFENGIYDSVASHSYYGAIEELHNRLD